MAKTLTKSSGRRARRPTPAKSAAKSRPAKPVAKSAVRSAPKSPSRGVAKTAPAKPVPKAALTKASLAKKPVTKSSGAKLPPLKALPKKAAPAKAPAARSKPAAAADASPASEAEIIGAVTGKLASRAGAGTGGFSWLGATKTEAPPPAKEETPAPAEAPAAAAEAPAPAEVPVIIAPIIIEEVPPPVVVEEVVVVTVVEPEAPAPEESTPATEEESVTTEPVAEETSDEPQAGAVSVPAPVYANHDTFPESEDREEAYVQAFKTAAGRLGWALLLQGVVFGAFCILVKGGAPLAGLPHFLAGAIPLFAMLLVVASYVAYNGTRAVLDRLEGDRSSLTAQRKLAHGPALIILGVLLVAWFFIGTTVWFL